MINIINYYDLINYALLSILNHTDAPVLHHNGMMLLDLSNKDIEKSFKFYLEDSLNNKLVFGVNNIIVNSCEPKNNRRNTFGSSMNISCKFYVEDDSMLIDTIQLQNLTENIFKKYLSLKYSINKLLHKNLDTHDLVNILNALYIPKPLPRSLDYIVSDNNLKLFDINNNIDEYLVQEVKELLKI